MLILCLHFNPAAFGENLELLIFSDSDHAGELAGRKSTTGIGAFINGCCISWYARTQKSIAISSTEADSLVK